MNTAVPQARGPGGGERIRTVDFYIANVALYQLSYTPECLARLVGTDEAQSQPGPKECPVRAQSH